MIILEVYIFLNKHGFIKDFVYRIPLDFIISFNTSNWTYYKLNLFSKITTIHNLIHLLAPKFLLPLTIINKIFIYLKQYKIKYAVKHSDFIIINSTQTKNEINKLFKINKKSIKIINLGIDNHFLS